MPRIMHTAVRRLLAAAALGAGVTYTALPAGASPAAHGIKVSFDDGCSAAVVSASGPVSELTTVFSDKRRERVAELPPASTYIVRVSPVAVESGLTITTLYVQPGDAMSRTASGARRDDGAERFECASRNAPESRLRKVARP